MRSASSYNSDLLEMTGSPGDYVKIVPSSDPTDWYEGTILSVYTDSEGLPLALRIKPGPTIKPGVLQQTIPWDAIESINFIDFVSEEPQA